jgi:hypothetical protein
MIKLIFALSMTVVSGAQEPDDSLQAIANSVKIRTAETINAIEATLPTLQEELRLKKRAIISGPRSKSNVSVSPDGKVEYYFYPTKEMKNEAIRLVETSLKESEKTLEKLRHGQVFNWPAIRSPLQLNEFGLLGTGRVVEVIDETSAVIRIEQADSPTSESTEFLFILKDVDTKNMSEHSVVDLPDIYRVTETTEYETDTLGTRTLFVLSPLDKDKVVALLKK